MAPENRLKTENFEGLDPSGDIELETQVKLKEILAIAGIRVAQADRLFTTEEYRAKYPGMPFIPEYTFHYSGDKAFNLYTQPRSWEKIEETDYTNITFLPDETERGHGLYSHGWGVQLSICDDKMYRNTLSAYLTAPQDARNNRNDLFGFSSKGPYAFNYFSGASHLLDRLNRTLSMDPEFVSTKVQPNTGFIGVRGWREEQRYIRRFVVS